MHDFNRYFESLGIEHGTRHAAEDSTTVLYRRVLGSAWQELPETVRRIHDAAATVAWRGRARVTRGTGVLARLVGGLFRFPRASDDVSVVVEFRRDQGRETWVRDFAGRRFSSMQFEGRGAHEGLLCERFGPFTFGLATIVENGQLRLPVRRWSMLGLQLPLWLAPQSHAREFGENGRFHFDVDISLPMIGPVVRYQGYLAAPTPSRHSRAPN